MMEKQCSYYIVNKPVGMLSQFSPEGTHTTLADLPLHLNKDMYPVGRLDVDSEGLLVLTNDNFLKTQVLNPQSNKEKEYWVQVDGEITDEAIAQLQSRVAISIGGKKYLTMPSVAQKIDEPTLPERTPPVRKRKLIPTSWISLSIVEGKNRQVRKMTAAVGFPTLRLIRVRIGSLVLETMQPGEILEIGREKAYTMLNK